MVEGKVVVVTGAGAGIGREFARAFAANGAKVIVNDPARIPDENVFAADRVVEEIKRAGGEAAAVIESVAEWGRPNESFRRHWITSDGSTV